MAQNGLHPVSKTRHGHRYWRRFSDYGFARQKADCPVVAAEIHQVAAAFPVLFHRRDSFVEPLAILSLVGEAGTPFVSRNGMWLAGYVPSALRCTPFEIAPDDQDPEAPVSLMIDEATGLVSDNPKDEAFFTKTGDLSPELQKVCAFLQNRRNAGQQTLALCRQIDKMNLYDPLTRHDGVDLPPGLLCVNEERLANLPIACSVALLASGALRLIHAHQLSLCHCAWVERAQRQAMAASTTRSIQTNPDVLEFLSAIADDQQRESFTSHKAVEGFHVAI